MEPSKYSHSSREEEGNKKEQDQGKTETQQGKRLIP